MGSCGAVPPTVAGASVMTSCFVQHYMSSYTFEPYARIYARHLWPDGAAEAA